MSKGRCIFHLSPQRESGLYVTFFPCPKPAEYRSVVLDLVEPLIRALRSNLKSWYFINHGFVDVGLFPKSASRLKRDLLARDLPCLSIKPLTPKQYGGKNGVALCYASLHSFSEVVLEVLRGQFGFSFKSQLLHYFTNQCGMTNEQEALFYSAIGGSWAQRTLGEWK